MVYLTPHWLICCYLYDSAHNRLIEISIVASFTFKQKDDTVHYDGHYSLKVLIWNYQYFRFWSGIKIARSLQFHDLRLIMWYVKCQEKFKPKWKYCQTGKTDKTGNIFEGSQTIKFIVKPKKEGNNWHWEESCCTRKIHSQQR